MIVILSLALCFRLGLYMVKILLSVGSTLLLAVCLRAWCQLLIAQTYSCNLLNDILCFCRLALALLMINSVL